MPGGTTRRDPEGLCRLTHIDDPERGRFYREILAADEAPDPFALDERHRRLVTMLAWDLASGKSGRADLSVFLRDLWQEEAVKAELSELLASSPASPRPALRS